MEGGEDAVAGPPPDASPFLMEDVLHRLHLLRYEETYLVPRDLAPFHKFQFSSAGAGNQFPAFVGLVTYLLTEARRKFAVDRFDDPTTVLTKLVAELRAMGAPADVMDFQPLKLRTGCGEAPCRILLFCADAALAARGFKWARPVYPEEAASAEVEEEDDEGGEGVEDGIAEDVASDEDVLFAPSGALGIKHASSSGAYAHSGGGGGGGAAQTGITRLAIPPPAVDSVAWRAEVERAGARLRAPLRLGGGSSVPLGALGGLRGSGSGGSSGSGVGSGAAAGSMLSLGEWRGHLEGTQASARTVAALAQPAFASLRALTEELVEGMGSVSAREAGLNTAYSSQVKEHGACAEAAAALSATANNAQSRVTGLSAELAAVGEAAEEVKVAMEERGSTMADASPLIRIKAALSAMRSDIKDLDVQLGVLGHAVMQQRLEARHNSHIKLRAAASAAGQKLRAHSSP